MSKVNGEDTICKVYHQWDEHREDFILVRNKVDTMHEALTNLKEHTQHLEKLDSISIAIVDMRDTLIGAATGRDQLPLTVGMTVIKTLTLVIMGLVFVIGSLLVGEHFGIIRELVK